MDTLVERAKVIVHLDVQIAVEIADDGYLGTDATVIEHINKAREDAALWRWSVQRGSTDLEVVRGVAQVTSVTIIPKEL